MNSPNNNNNNNKNTPLAKYAKFQFTILLLRCIHSPKLHIISTHQYKRKTAHRRRIWDALFHPNIAMNALNLCGIAGFSVQDMRIMQFSIFYHLLALSVICLWCLCTKICVSCGVAIAGTGSCCRCCCYCRHRHFFYSSNQLLFSLGLFFSPSLAFRPVPPS